MDNSYIMHIYRQRFSNDDNHMRLNQWFLLTKYVLGKYVESSDTVMDFGAGYCEFLRSIHCNKKIAVDINPDCKVYAGKEIQVLQCLAQEVPTSYNNKIDVIMMSNFLEHMKTKDEVFAVLHRSHKLLRKGGRLLVLGPNIDLVKERYWDFIDHHVALNDKSLKEALSIADFTIVKSIRRFLPYTTKSSLPKSNLLLQLYLSLPPTLRPFAGQSFIVAKKV